MLSLCVDRDSVFLYGRFNLTGGYHFYVRDSGSPYLKGPFAVLGTMV